MLSAKKWKPLCHGWATCKPLRTSLAYHHFAETHLWSPLLYCSALWVAWNTSNLKSNVHTLTPMVHYKWLHCGKSFCNDGTLWMEHLAKKVWSHTLNKWKEDAWSRNWPQLEEKQFWWCQSLANEQEMGGLLQSKCLYDQQQTAGSNRRNL